MRLRPGWLYFDIEGTGLSVSEDRIVELCLYPVEGELRVRRINPTIPIPPESTAIHGITDEDVRDCPTFRQVAGSVQELVDDAVALCGYSIRKYDTLLLDEELRRAGRSGLPRDDAGKLSLPEIDLYHIWQKNDPRSLVAAVKKFAGVDLEDAHSADADTLHLPATLEGMLEEYGMAECSTEELAAFCVPEGEIDRAGKFKRTDDGTIIFNFGKDQRGKPVLSDSGFLQWMLGKDFPEETKAFARQFLVEIFGPPVAAGPPPQEELF